MDGLTYRSVDLAKEMDSAIPEKRFAAESAADLVRDGLVVGLGSGSTAEIAIQFIGEKVKKGLQIIGVPTSEKSEAVARTLGIRLSTLSEHPELDLTIDGADEVELGSLDLIKGLGGALLREKIVASSSKRLIIIVDESKVVNRLGSHGVVPVEIVPFGWQSTVRRLSGLGWRPTLRLDAERIPFITDGGHYILDCSFDPGISLQARAADLHDTVGVVEHGMFLGMAAEVHVGGRTGVRILRKNSI
jgi:ribose 5-phosphate isomerase A